MKVTYIYHSGFAVELERCVLLFDYYKGKLPEWERDKAVYVFASHKHRDHFSMEIFGLAQQYGKVHFFLGSDIKLSGKYLERNGVPVSVKEKITTAGKNRELEWDGLRIRTLRSTDAGVAFAVYAEGMWFYHAGDLNWWHWDEEDTQWNENMERDYKREIDALRDISFEAAFVPLDPRLDRAYGWGMDYFLEHADARYVFPMHMWEDYGLIGRYKGTDMGKRYRERIMDIAEAGQEFDL